MNRALTLSALAVLSAAVVGSPTVVLAQEGPAIAQADLSAPAQRAQAMIDKGLLFLKSAQNPDGSWQNEKEPPAMTAIVLRAFVADKNYDSKTDFIAKGYEKLLSHQMEDGGIYKDILANYNTAIAVSALAAANDPAFKTPLDKAVAYLKGLQWTENTVSAENEKISDQTDPWYGGWGYGGRSRGGGRPDLSNAQLAIEALNEAGVKPEDPAFQAALKFLTRTQNLSETNDQPWAGDDGGFIYGPSDKRTGESAAGEYITPDGVRRLRSYGSMTYAGLKSMIYAGLSKDDPRVKAAWGWISANWTLDENPGMKLGNPDNARNGLYYYYMTLGRALNVYDEPIIHAPDGKTHDWRIELIEKLASLQAENGSWTGEGRWMEGNPVLTTSYVVMALQDALEDLEQHPAK